MVFKQMNAHVKNNNNNNNSPKLLEMKCKWNEKQ